MDTQEAFASWRRTKTSTVQAQAQAALLNAKAKVTKFNRRDSLLAAATKCRSRCLIDIEVMRKKLVSVQSDMNCILDAKDGGEALMLVQQHLLGDPVSGAFRRDLPLLSLTNHCSDWPQCHEGNRQVILKSSHIGKQGNYALRNIHFQFLFDH
jgi:hypothetical protein